MNSQLHFGNLILLVSENGERESRYRITDIIGSEDGLGVENLQGSGMIAGESSLAYDEIVTANLVTCRAIGIGAYLVSIRLQLCSFVLYELINDPVVSMSYQSTYLLRNLCRCQVRLGQRTVQVETSHIILTGAAALNKVLGREVYTSNAQLGGIQIMHNNGVSHAVVPNDFEGICLIARWLSYIPAFKGESDCLLGSDGCFFRVVPWSSNSMYFRTCLPILF